MPELIARIAGGLGNQLFIYATAKALAISTGAKLVLDTKTGFRHDIYRRRFALHCFDIQYKEANVLERFDFPAGRGFRYLFRKVNQYLPFQHRFYLTENAGKKRSYMPELSSFQPAGCTWIEGYWQSPLYFEDIRETLTKELTVKSPLSPETLRVAEQITSANSVCVHLRLSRNMVDGKTIAAGKQLDWQYFVKCMEGMTQNIENPRFFFFSDNPEAAQKLHSLPFDVVLVSHNKGDEQAHEDFYLMSLCSHFILSNSTFGWWPAWLNTRPDSVVVAPPLPYWDNRDILPAIWITSDRLIDNLKELSRH